MTERANSPRTSSVRLSKVVEALRGYKQTDEDGVMVLVSRQACDEGAEAIERLVTGRGPDDPAMCPARNGDSCCGWHDACIAALKR